MRLFVSDIKMTRELTVYIYCRICISNIQKESQTLNIDIKTGTLRGFLFISCTISIQTYSGNTAKSSYYGTDYRAVYHWKWL